MFDLLFGMMISPFLFMACMGMGFFMRKRTIKKMEHAEYCDGDVALDAQQFFLKKLAACKVAAPLLIWEGLGLVFNGAYTVLSGIHYYREQLAYYTENAYIFGANAAENAMGQLAGMLEVPLIIEALLALMLIFGIIAQALGHRRLVEHLKVLDDKGLLGPAKTELLSGQLTKIDMGGLSGSLLMGRKFLFSVVYQSIIPYAGIKDLFLDEVSYRANRTYTLNVFANDTKKKRVCFVFQKKERRDQAYGCILGNIRAAGDPNRVAAHEKALAQRGKSGEGARWKV